MRAALIIAALSLAACERVESSNVRTDGIYADLDVVAKGDGKSSVSASLRVGGSLSNTYLDLIDGDVLMAHQADDAQEMERRTLLFGQVWYEATFDVDAENTPFRIEFAREPHDDTEKQCRGGSAPNSFATLPAPFAFDGPEVGKSFSRANDDLEITWSPNGSSDKMSFQISGSCIQSESGDISGDPGRLAIARGRLKPTMNQPPATCAIIVELIRSRSGEVDPAFGEGGTFRARQIRTLDLQSAP
jgi:hypothetical protein